MLGDFIKRVVNVAVLGLAALAFFLVPLGKKTAFQHAVAIFTSRPAREAGTAVAGASQSVFRTVRAEVRKALADAASHKPDAPEEATHSEQESAPKPEPSDE